MKATLGWKRLVVVVVVRIFVLHEGVCPATRTDAPYSGGRTPGSKLPASPPPLLRPDGGGQPWPCACALKNQTPRRPTRACRQPCPKVSANCGDSTVFCAVRTIPEPVIAGKYTLSKNCACVNSTGICTVWTSALHTTGKATCPRTAPANSTYTALSGPCQAPVNAYQRASQKTLSRSEELHCGISTIFST